MGGKARQRRFALDTTTIHNTSLKAGGMNKSELIDAVAADAELTKADASRAVEAFVNAVTKSLKGGDSVTMVGFGTFSVRKRAARTGRDPRTGKSIKIKASTVPGFKAGKALKDAIN